MITVIIGMEHAIQSGLYSSAHHQWRVCSFAFLSPLKYGSILSFPAFLFTKFLHPYVMIFEVVLRKVNVGSIGKTTADALINMGFTVHATAAAPSPNHLVDAICSYDK
jgi:uroporphyrinogen-III synthase